MEEQEKTEAAGESEASKEEARRPGQEEGEERSREGKLKEKSRRKQGRQEEVRKEELNSKSKEGVETEATKMARTLEKVKECLLFMAGFESYDVSLFGKLRC